MGRLTNGITKAAARISHGAQCDGPRKKSAKGTAAASPTAITENKRGERE
jgi:hypothetical protein